MKVVSSIGVPSVWLIENIQSIDSFYALGEHRDGVFQQTSPLFKCRDFFTDTIINHHIGRCPSIYGFYAEKYLWDMTGIIFSTSYPILEYWPIVRSVLKETGLPQISLQKTEVLGNFYKKVNGDPIPPEHIYWAKLPKWYTESSFRMSLFSGILRWGAALASYKCIDFYNTELMKSQSTNSVYFVPYMLHPNLWPHIKDIIFEKPTHFLESDDPVVLKILDNIKNGIPCCTYEGIPEHEGGEFEDYTSIEEILEETLHDQGGIQSVGMAFKYYKFIPGLEEISSSWNHWPSSVKRMLQSEICIEGTNNIITTAAYKRCKELATNQELTKHWKKLA